MATSNPTAGRRLSLITVDQVLSGGSNFLAALAAAHLLPVAAFGRFAVVFLTFVFVQGVARALVSEPSLVHPHEVTTAPGRILSSGYAVALGLGVLVVAGGAVTTTIDDELGRGLVLLGVLFPLLSVQDLGRYVGISRNRPGDAILLDVVWLALLLVGLGWLLLSDTPDLVDFLAVWAGSGALAGLLTPWLHRRAGGRFAIGWLVSTWSLAWRYLVSNLINQGGALAAALIVLVVASAHSLGSLQAAQLLTRPFTVFLVAASSAGVSELARLASTDPAYARTVRLTTWVVTAVATGTLLVMVVLPDPLGRIVLGDTWPTAEPLLLPAGLQLVFIGLLAGARIGLYGMRRMGVVMVLDLVGTSLLMVGILIGLAVDGVLGALWGLVAAQAVVAAATVLVFARLHPAPAPRATVSPSVGASS